MRATIAMPASVRTIANAQAVVDMLNANDEMGWTYYVVPIDADAARIGIIDEEREWVGWLGL